MYEVVDVHELVPVYTVRPIDGGTTKVLHRNMLMLANRMPENTFGQEGKKGEKERKKRKTRPKLKTPDHNLTSDSESDRDWNDQMNSLNQSSDRARVPEVLFDDNSDWGADLSSDEGLAAFDEQDEEGDAGGTKEELSPDRIEGKLHRPEDINPVEGGDAEPKVSSKVGSSRCPGGEHHPDVGDQSVGPVETITELLEDMPEVRNEEWKDMQHQETEGLATSEGEAQEVLRRSRRIRRRKEILTYDANFEPKITVIGSVSLLCGRIEPGGEKLAKGRGGPHPLHM